MAEQRTGKTQEIHEVYEQCKKVFEPSLSLIEEYSNIEDQDEKEFYVNLRDFFMQQKQQEVIQQGIF